MPGRFVAFEGGEGTGKSTQARMLADALGERGHKVVLTREPGGTPGAETIRAMLLDRAFNWSLRAEALLFAAARADHVGNFIRPAIDRGAWVVCDRFIDSSRAYQAGEGALTDNEIMDLHRAGSEGLMPDVTVLITVSPETAAQRLAARDGSSSDRIGGRPEAYHARVARRFTSLAEAEPGRFAMIDGEGAPDDVHNRVLAALGMRT